MRLGSREESRIGMTTLEGALVALVLIFGTMAFAYLSAVRSNSEAVASLQSQVAGLQTTTTKSSAATSQSESTVAVTTVAPTIRHITLVAEPETVTIATNVSYDAWTFNGTVPGPTIMVNQGDTIIATFINNFTNTAHSIDFHAAQVSWSADYQPVAPGQRETFNFTVDYPGVFMYHCGTPPALQHIANGMYGAIIVNPSTPLPPAPGGQYVLIQSEWYLNAKPGSDGNYAGNYTKMVAGTPSYVVFNGKSNQYQVKPLTVLPDQLVRLYVLNAGPDLWSAFHVIGALFDTVYIDGNPANAEHGLQTLNIPPSGGAIVDMYFADPGGKNPFVTHDFADAVSGAAGAFVVESGTTTATSTTTSSGTTSISPTVVHVSLPAGSATDTTSTGFTPSTITVVIGVNNTVEWKNNDDTPHTVTAVDKSFDSGNLNAGDVFTYTFTTSGTYQYSCSYHPWMKGTVIVKAG